MYRIGIDLGGTKIEGVLLEMTKSASATQAPYLELARLRVATERHKGYHSILRKIKEVVETLTQKIPGQIYTLGIGTPGSLSPKTKLLRGSNSTELNGMAIKNDLEELLKHSIQLENDANCFAMAEAKGGAGKGHRIVFGVIMGTGCGGGLILDGKLWQGRNAIGGEWGHMSLDPLGPECYCGRRGCVETYISGGGLEKGYLLEYGQAKSLTDIARDFRKGLEPESTYFKLFLDHYGKSLANLINALDPEMIVLGGGVSNIPELYTLGYEQVKKNVFSDVFETPILKNELGDSAGVIGAALLGV